MRHPNPSSLPRSLLAARAHGLRSVPTLSEQRLWQALSREQLGVVFRRQVPLGHRFIVDFFAPALKLVVEVDGSAHEHRRLRDARRDDKLRRLGYQVLRLDAELVLRALPRAVERVRAEVERLRR